VRQEENSPLINPEQTPGFSPGSVERADFSAKERILIVEVNWLGDVLFSTPAIRAIRNKYPGGPARQSGPAGE
jgi:hypothetical protein